MKLRTFLAGAVCATLLIGLTTEVMSQQSAAEKPEGMPMPSAEEQAKMMQEWMRLSQPGEGHKHLDHFVGDWNLTIRMYMGGPTSEPTETKGTSTVKKVLGGRYLMENMDAEMDYGMGQPLPFEGLGLIGYDNFRNMYTTTWCDNMGTALIVLRGGRHPHTGLFTYYGELDEPMMKVVGRTIKSTTRVINDDKHVFELYDLHVSDDYKVMEIVYERK